METTDLGTNLDTDSNSFAEMILAKARFHRVLVESLEKSVKKDRKEEKKRRGKGSDGKKRKSDEKRRKSKKDKDKKEKHKVKNERDTDQIQEMLEKIKKQKQKIRKEKDKEKKKKKKSKKKKKKRDSKTKTIATIEVSDDESGDLSLNTWWSIGIEEKRAEGDKKKNTKKSIPLKKNTKKSQIVNKIPLKKEYNLIPTKGVDQTELNTTEHSNTGTCITEQTSPSSLESSQRSSLHSPIVRKVSYELDSDVTANSASVMWWDNAKDTPSRVTNSLPSKAPTTTPTIASKRSFVPTLLSPASDTSDSDYDDVSINSSPSKTPTTTSKRSFAPTLLSPRSDTSDSDYDDDVSIFSEESLSEQILEDLSCILDFSEESDSDFEGTPISKKNLSREESGKSYDCSSICSGPFTLVSPLRKVTSFKECVTPISEKHLSSVKIVSCRPSPYNSKTPISKKNLSRDESGKSYDCSSICSGPFPLSSPLRKVTSFKECVTPISEKYLSSVKIVSSRPSPCNNKGNINPCTSPHASPSAASNASSNDSSSPSSSTSNHSPKSSSHTGSRTEPTQNSPLEISIEMEDSPKSAKSSTLDGIKPISREGLFGRSSIQMEESPKSAVSTTVDGIKPVPREGLFGRRPCLPSCVPLT